MLQVFNQNIKKIENFEDVKKRLESIKNTSKAHAKESLSVFKHSDTVFSTYFVCSSFA